MYANTLKFAAVSPSLNFFSRAIKTVPDRQIENETDCLLSLIIIILLFKAFYFFVLSVLDKQRKRSVKYCKCQAKNKSEAIQLIIIASEFLALAVL